MDAPDRAKAAVAKVDRSWEEILRTRRDWWSLHPVKSVAIPTPKNASWSSEPIDRFILARLEEAGITPADPADPRAYSPAQPGADRPAADPGANSPVRARLRRHVGLTPRRSPTVAGRRGGEAGRCPAPVAPFRRTLGPALDGRGALFRNAWQRMELRGTSRLALSRLPDPCLQRPTFPTTSFVMEHIAGDLLPEPRWNVREKFNESVIGTAFYRFGEVNHDDCVSLRQIGYDLADNQIDTLTKAFQGLTVACARCHDHKLDAVSMRDYYGLLGILRSSRCVSHTIDAPEVNAGTIRAMRDRKPAIRRELAKVWLKETPDIARYLPAALAQKLAKTSPPVGLDDARLKKWLAVLDDDKAGLENPLTAWRLIASIRQKENVSFADAWKKIADKFQRENAEGSKFNEGFTTLADFRKGTWPGWQVGGQGLRDGPTRAGDFAVAMEGDAAVSALLPAGCFTHGVSDKLNGTLRSPTLTPSKKQHISFQVMGQRSSAVRLVSNNCQLNYANSKVLRSDEFGWVTFSVPKAAENLRPYAELMTMFDNPKFPDQLATLGGDKMDYRVPWDKAAANPRSFFGVTRVVLHDGPAPPKADLGHLRTLFADPPPETAAELAQRYVARLEAAIQAWMNDRATDDDIRWLDPLVQRGLLSNRADLTPALKNLIAEYRRLDGELSLPRIVPGLADGGSGFDQPVFVRGDCMKPGDPARRRYVEVISPAPISSPGSGRLELAKMIASADNPLTARVMVNRIWHHLFGTGLVRTVDDFGHVGELPSHPELLDHLAQRFVAGGWSMKRLIREIVLTRTFQLSHHPSAAAVEADPNNRLLGRYPARRLEAEAIRDSLLAASGRLDRTLFGMSIPAYRDQDNTDRRLFRGPLDGNGRRSIYIRVTLMEAPKFLDAFDLPGGKVTQGRRDVTHVPAQALAMLNDPFVLGQAEVWGKRLVQRKSDSIPERITAMFRQALGRDPRPEETERFVRFVGRMAALHGVADAGVLENAAVWRDVAHTVFNLQEFISVP